jgi:hypothetical protein
MKKINAREVLEQFDNDTELFKTVVDQFNEELPRYVKRGTSEVCETTLRSLRKEKLERSAPARTQNPRC